jgi:hemerythrin
MSTEFFPWKDAYSVSVIEIDNQHRDKNSSALTYKLINFLREWLVNHILVSDKEYVKCFKENGLR